MWRFISSSLCWNWYPSSSSTPGTYDICERRICSESMLTLRSKRLMKFVFDSRARDMSLPRSELGKVGALTILNTEFVVYVCAVPANARDSVKVVPLMAVICSCSWVEPPTPESSEMIQPTSSTEASDCDTAIVVTVDVIEAAVSPVILNWFSASSTQNSCGAANSSPTVDKPKVTFSLL